MVQWLGLQAPNAEGMDLIPGQKTKFPQASRQGKKQIKEWNKNNNKTLTWKLDGELYDGGIGLILREHSYDSSLKMRQSGYDVLRDVIQ